MKTPKELFIEARDNQLQVVAGHRVAVLKALDDLASFNGEDDYQICLATVVGQFPEGIVITQIREVLPNGVILDSAIKKLIEDKTITSEPYGKRSQLLKPVKKEPLGKGESFNTNPTGNPNWESMPPSEVTSKKAASQPATAAATQD